MTKLELLREITQDIETATNVTKHCVDHPQNIQLQAAANAALADIIKLLLIEKKIIIESLADIEYLADL